MDRETILRLAREAGLMPDNSHPTAQTRHMAQKERSIERFASLIAVHERNRICAMLDGLQKKEVRHNYYGFIRNLIFAMK